MKKPAICLGIALLIILGIADWATAAPDLLGTYSGYAKKITLNGCSKPWVKVVISKQCGTLFSGTVKIKTKEVDFVGRIEADKSLFVHGFYSSVPDYGSVVFWGKYLTNPNRIKIHTFDFYYNDSDSNYEYSIFTLKKR
ncbi:MAG: hypothetical protein JRI66_10080 [Deltaproteobacteria bacterium]|nr:hypothetical protein [Deltaproteobacteria bacterium]